MSMFIDIFAALLALGTAAVWILTARGELPPVLGSSTDHVAWSPIGRALAMKAPRFRSRPQRWNRRRAREFGLRGGIMAPIERFFLATTVSGFLGLIGSIVWLMVR